MSGRSLFVFLSLIVWCCSPGGPKKDYLLSETDLVPEGIAYSKKKGKFYLTSIAKAKIISVDVKTGKQEDFIRSHQAGFMPGVGILVDEKKEVLYALGGYFPISDSISTLFTFDLNTKGLTKRYRIQDEEEHFMNDLVQDAKGNLYITDSKSSAVYQLGIGKDSLELFFRSNEIQYPNGIAISDDNSKLYIASFSKGVRVLDLNSKKILNPPDTLGISQGLDGLEFYKDHLYAVQNGVRKIGDNFRKLELSATGDRIKGFQIYHTGELLDLPLTFCIVDGRAIIIANSNLQYLDQTNLQITAPDSIRPTRLISVDLAQL